MTDTNWGPTAKARRRRTITKRRKQDGGQATVTMLKSAAGPDRNLQAGQEYNLPITDAQLMVAAGSAKSEGLKIPDEVYAMLKPMKLSAVKKQLRAAVKVEQTIGQRVSDLDAVCAQQAGRLEQLRAEQGAIIDLEELDDLEALEKSATATAAQLTAVENILAKLTAKRDVEARELQTVRTEVTRLETLRASREYVQRELDVIDKMQPLRPMLEELQAAWESAFGLATPDLQPVITQRIIEPLLDAIDAREKRGEQLKDVLA